MSKSNSIKKLSTKRLSPPLNKAANDVTPKKYNISNRNINNNDNHGIIEVYEDNFIQELKNLSCLLEEYNYIGMDTEFPGTVFCVQNLSEDFYFKTLKLNVDKLKLIQLGITLTNSKGEFPKNYSYHTWQFNFEFDQNKDKFSPSSLKLLVDCGIDFNKLKKRGIKHKIFAEYFMISGLVLNPDIYWVSFHGSYDFGYLLRLLLNKDLPDTEQEFINELNDYFINYYDIRILVKGKDNLQGSLNRLAQSLQVLREGKTHQAGSDSVVTIDVFFKLIENGAISKEQLPEMKNIVFGIGLGEDNEETINYYTKLGNLNYQNNNTNNLMFLPMNTHYMQYYYQPMILNNVNNTNNGRQTQNNNNYAQIPQQTFI